MSDIDTIVSIVADGEGISKAMARRIVSCAFDVTAQQVALAGGSPLRLPGLGTLTVTDRAASTGRNPRTGEPIAIPARRTVRFRAAPALKRAVNKPAELPRLRQAGGRG